MFLWASSGFTTLLFDFTGFLRGFDLGGGVERASNGIYGALRGITGVIG